MVDPPRGQPTRGGADVTASHKSAKSARLLSARGCRAALSAERSAGQRRAQRVRWTRLFGGPSASEQFLSTLQAVAPGRYPRHYVSRIPRILFVARKITRLRMGATAAPLSPFAEPSPVPAQPQAQALGGRWW